MSQTIEVTCPECKTTVECEVELDYIFETTNWVWCEECGGEFAVYADDNGEVWTEDF